MAQQVRASCESGVEDFTDWILDYYSGIKRGTISSLYLRTGNKSGSQFPSRDSECSAHPNDSRLLPFDLGSNARAAVSAVGCSGILKMISGYNAHLPWRL